MADIIQLDFSEIDDRWWINASIWSEWGLIDTIARPTEDAALTNVYRQARLLERAGRMTNLSRLHKECLKWEYQCKRWRPYDLDAPRYVGERVGVGRNQAAALLYEASAILMAREIMGLPTAVDWRGERDLTVFTVKPNKRGKRIA